MFANDADPDAPISFQKDDTPSHYAVDGRHYLDHILSQTYPEVVTPRSECNYSSFCGITLSRK